LLELKLAAIRRLAHDDAFAMFGRGWHPGFADLYGERLRADLSPPSAAFWDAHGHWFARREANLFTQGLAGLVTRGVHWRFGNDRRLGECVRTLFDQPDLAAQRAYYDEYVRPRFWTPLVRWFLATPLFLSLVGVPLAQRRLLRRPDGRGAGQVIQDMIDELFRCVPARDNYFWGVYVFGEYGGERVPRYLTPEGFALLKAGMVDRIEARTCTVTDYLRADGPDLTHAVLLDHMDWMSSYYPGALQEEWDALARRMRPGGTVLFRSAHVEPPFLQTLSWGGRRVPVRAALEFRDVEARDLARADRVHTYPGFHIARVPG
jgi:S-adenosylmethionine-diacylglycerol 3-amino-3-carboxypropyl transferase